MHATETITRTAASPQGNAQVMVFGFASKLTSNMQKTAAPKLSSRYVSTKSEKKAAAPKLSSEMA